MPPTLAEFMHAFDTYSNHIVRNERDVRENGHRGRLPPICFGDPWDEDFAAAYQALSPYLSKVCKVRYFAVPPGLAFHATPIKAETACEALMIFLNPPEELHGEPGVLDSTEYKALKAAAMAELTGLARSKNATDRQKTELPTRNRKPKDPLALSDNGTVLLAYLMKSHQCNTAEPIYTPVGNQEFIAEQLSTRAKEWNQSGVSRAMDELLSDIRGFDHLGAMTRYRRLCDARQICTVLMKICLKPLRKGMSRELGVEDIDQFEDRRF